MQYEQKWQIGSTSTNNLNDWLIPFQILLGPNTGMSGGMPGMMPPAPGKMWDTERGQHEPEIYCSAIQRGRPQGETERPRRRAKNCSFEKKKKKKKQKLYVNSMRLTPMCWIGWRDWIRRMWCISNTSVSLSLLIPTSHRDLFPGALLLFSFSFLNKYLYKHK